MQYLARISGNGRGFNLNIRKDKIMQYKKWRAIGLAAAIGLAFGPAAQAFVIDVGAATPGFADPSADGDRIFSSIQNVDQLQFNIAQNQIFVEGFNLGTAAVGDTFNITDSGFGNFTAPLPSTTLTDSEGYLSLWELNGNFDLTGTATLTGISGNQVDFDFTFTGGSLDILYDESFDLAANGPNLQQVLLGDLLSGGGDARQTVGSTTQDVGSFVADFNVTDLLDGFWLQNDRTPFVDNLTLLFADGNINEVVANQEANGLSIMATSDGSIRFEGQRPPVVPEPGTIGLLGLGLISLGGIAHRRRRAA